MLEVVCGDTESPRGSRESHSPGMTGVSVMDAVLKDERPACLRIVTARCEVMSHCGFDLHFPDDW